MSFESYSDDRFRQLTRWKRNRDHTNGVDAVKQAGERYLPRPDEKMSDLAYQNYLIATEYFPAASRTLQSFIGLTFRKTPTLLAPQPLLDLAPYITLNARSVEEQVRWLFKEYAITNDGGALIDHVETPKGLSQFDKEDLGLLPYTVTYTAEAILEIRHGRVKGREGVSYVRLRDSATKIRELELIAGIYTVTVHEQTKGRWQSSRTIPIRDDQPMNEIPFVWFRAQKDEEGSDFDDLCAANETHYYTSSLLATAFRWVVHPVRIATGVDKDAVLPVEAGVMWRLEDENAKVQFEEYKGDGIPALERQLDRLEKHMVELGSRMLASEKAPAEAAETIARRQASENSILASMGRHVGARYQAVLRHVAAWMGLDPLSVTFSLNADFVPAVIDGAVLLQLVQMNQANKLSDRLLFEAMKKGELIEEGVTFEQHQDELDAQPIDRPRLTGPISDDE